MVRFFHMTPLSSTSLEIVPTCLGLRVASLVSWDVLSCQLHVPGLTNENAISHFLFPFLHFQFLFLDQPHRHAVYIDVINIA